jgi:hypothetical protein
MIAVLYAAIISAGVVLPQRIDEPEWRIGSTFLSIIALPFVLIFLSWFVIRPGPGRDLIVWAFLLLEILVSGVAFRTMYPANVTRNLWIWGLFFLVTLYTSWPARCPSCGWLGLRVPTGFTRDSKLRKALAETLEHTEYRWCAWCGAMLKCIHTPDDFFTLLFAPSWLRWDDATGPEDAAYWQSQMDDTGFRWPRRVLGRLFGRHAASSAVESPTRPLEPPPPGDDS